MFNPKFKNKKSMSKTELTGAVALKSGLSQTDAAKAVNALLATVAERMCAGEAVQIPGFGSFTVRERKARTGRNPRTGATMKIAAKKVVRFTAGSALKL